ncbi:hypothetical protein M409DRAFT_17750 [Zasmidium cellare ATCC 36951]|uniref:ABC transporter domain-containing protein n=1 Tax=Zasmidium cellare ATCC 36951 TaxID=1080233 RepID=A0A6A6CZ71_ZASCE|nr:uncharacterized protein M409DRAFT_17750 [Zasmidium cellare ATCC 36951]KAF2172517.1 hypothetical protein M409DRAFT_17750 [Zasmidium cellare ATCC 36951]
MSIPASLTQARAAATSALSNPAFQDSPFANMSTKEFNVTAYTLNSSQRGCYRVGALPIALGTNDTCALGFHCPKSSNEFPPQYCHPTEECAVMRASRRTCDPQGTLEPKVCANGFYCPPGGKQQLPCPKGTFCPSGSFEPFNCTYAAICPAKSVRQLNVLPLYLTVIIDLTFVFVVIIIFCVQRRRRNRSAKSTTPVPEERSQTILLQTPGSPGTATPGRTQSPSISSAGSSDSSRPPSTNPSTNPRRANARVDHYDGYADDDNVSTLYDEDVENELQNSPNMQRFIRSMSKAVETSCIGLSFDFENLSFCAKGGKKILTDITGTMPRGSCWGIMGGSGAGKSTFVNVLMGKTHATNGTIKINGHRQDMSKYKKLIGYVPQDDIVFPELTVRENILHSAHARLPQKWRDREIQEHVDSLIASLQLTHVQHSRVGDATRPVISGGQRKRVNIGMELAAAPMAIFLDEPTSGLDATSAASIMKLLRAISRLGVTTIAIVHQPRERIFQGFDQVLLLAEGRSVYSGPTEAVQTYFEGLGYAFPQKANPADALIDIITGDGAEYCMSATKCEQGEVGFLIEAWKAGSQYMKTQNKHLSLASTQSEKSRRISNQSLNSTAEQEEALRRTMKLRGASWLAQVYYCWKRAATQQLRNQVSFLFEIGVGGLAGMIIGLSAFASNGHLFQGLYHQPFTLLSSAIDYNSTPQIGLLGAMAIGLAASAPGFWVFGEEKLMYWRETASGHSRSAYYVGKLLSTFLRIALSSWHFTVFLGVLATPLISFQEMYAANLMYFWCIYGLASIVSMLVKREDGPLLAVLASLIIGVLGGVAPPLAKVKSWHMEWFWRLSPGVWFTEAYFSQNVLPMKYLYITDLAAKSTGYTLGQYGMDIAMLFSIGVVYRLIAYLGLILMNRDKQR